MLSWLDECSLCANIVASKIHSLLGYSLVVESIKRINLQRCAQNTLHSEKAAKHIVRVQSTRTRTLK